MRKLWRHTKTPQETKQPNDWIESCTEKPIREGEGIKNRKLSTLFWLVKIYKGALTAGVEHPLPPTVSSALLIRLWKFSGCAISHTYKFQNNEFEKPIRLGKCTHLNHPKNDLLLGGEASRNAKLQWRCCTNWKMIEGIHNGCWVNFKSQKQRKLMLKQFWTLLNCSHACWAKRINGKKNQRMQLVRFKKQQQITMGAESKCVVVYAKL